jgi:hypothetical protein
MAPSTGDYNPHALGGRFPLRGDGRNFRVGREGGVPVIYHLKASAATGEGRRRGGEIGQRRRTDVAATMYLPFSETIWAVFRPGGGGGLMATRRDPGLARILREMTD